MIRTCKNCHYGLRGKLKVAEGQPEMPVVTCLLVPPKVMIDNGTITHRSPLMQPTGWCGQFRMGWRHLLSRSDG